jgi:hypothetical protein
MTALPVFFAVIFPVLLTTTAFVLLLDHVTRLFEAFEGYTAAFS